MADLPEGGEEMLGRLKVPAIVREDFERLVSETAGGMWQRPGLAARERSIATIAMLVALCRPEELREHIAFGLRNGLTREEICEEILHCAVYAGFPAAVRAMDVAHEVFGE